MIKFEKISQYAAADFNLPVRKTKCAAGYDFEIIEDIIIPPYLHQVGHMKDYINFDPTSADFNLDAITLFEMGTITKSTGAKPTLVPTGVKCQLEPGYYLELSVRSSTPLKYWLILANGVGIIDADYWNNEDNEGHIFFQVINLSPFPIQLHKGDIIGQGIIKRYEVTDDDMAIGDRVGGLGSTSIESLNSLSGSDNNNQPIFDIGLNITANQDKIIEELCKTGEIYPTTPVDLAQAITKASGITLEEAIANLSQAWNNLKTDIKTELL